MVLGIVTDCVHTRNKEGAASSSVHVFVKQMNELSKHFSKVIICCPFKNYKGENVTTYSNASINFIELPMAGGNSMLEKLKLIRTIPTWLKAFKQLNKQTDIVYLRFPNNLNIPGFLYFRFFAHKKTFATYTGSWDRSESSTYNFQKWMIRNFFKGPVWVYSLRKNLQSNIYQGFSPSNTLAEWQEETIQVDKRIERLNKEGISILKMISVGALIWYKNQQYILHTCIKLKEHNIPFKLTLVGEGELRNDYEKFIEENNLNEEVVLTGNLNQEKVRQLYRQHDFVVQAPLHEGFGKVPIEGFFHGLIPILNNLTFASHMVGANEERGFLFNVKNENDLFIVLHKIFEEQNNSKLGIMIKQGRIFSKTQTLENWASDYNKTIMQYFG